jgi:predicted Holliday junction resolvase-like endonuclease
MKSNVIDVLKTITSLKRITIKCPSCKTELSPQDCNLFDIRQPYPHKVKKLLQRQDNAIAKELKGQAKRETRILEKIGQTKDRYKKLNEKKAKHPQKVKVITRSVNIGQIVEKILPSSKQFKYDPSDCRVLLTPIDYIAFNGFTKKGKVDRLSFIEVKTGNARLQSNQSQIKELIESGKKKITLVEY